MRFVLIVTLFFSAAIYAAGQPGAQTSLAADIAEFEELIPIGSIKMAAVKYVLFYSEFRSWLDFLKGDETKEAWDILAEHDEVKNIVAYLNFEGVDTEKLINKYLKLLEYPGFPSLSLKLRGTSSVNRFLNEVQGLISMDKLEKLIKLKQETSPAFKELYDKVADIDYQEVSKFIENSEELTAWIAKVRSYNVDLDGWLQKFKDLFGWK